MININIIIIIKLNGTNITLPTFPKYERKDCIQTFCILDEYNHANKHPIIMCSSNFIYTLIRTHMANYAHHHEDMFLTKPTTEN